MTRFADPVSQEEMEIAAQDVVWFLMCKQARVAAYKIHYGLLQLVECCFFLNVSEKIIAEKTRHRSLAAYENTTHAQEQAGTKSLSSSMY